MKVLPPSQTPQNTDLSLPSIPYCVPSVRWDVVVCENNMEKPHWLLRNKVFARIYDAARGVYFGVKEMFTGKEKTPNDSIRGTMNTSEVIGTTDNPMSVYKVLFDYQCRAMSELIERMAVEGRLSDDDVEFISRKLLGSLTDKAKAALVVRALYGKNMFGE